MPPQKPPPPLSTEAWSAFHLRERDAVQAGYRQGVVTIAEKAHRERTLIRISRIRNPGYQWQLRQSGLG